MAFINTPNLPEDLVDLVVVDERISAEAEHTLHGMEISVLKAKSHKNLYPAVASHPDMMIHHIWQNIIICAPNTDAQLIRNLEQLGFQLLKGETFISSEYPLDIAYNVARVGRYYFHNLKYTDPVIKRELERLGVEPVNVKQGYAKCSVLVLNENSMVTSDPGIAKAAEGKGLNVLFVNERSIRLPGLNYGFIGGIGGMISKSALAINGGIEKLDSYNELVDFISKRNIKCVCLSDGDVTDIGSIIPLNTRDFKD